MKGDYHLIYFWETQEYRLYNVRKDIGEQNNLIADEPKLARKQARELAISLRKCDARRPALKATGELLPWPDGRK